MKGDNYDKALIISNQHSEAKIVKECMVRFGIDPHNIWVDNDPDYFMDILSYEEIKYIVIDWQEDDAIKEKILNLIAEMDIVNQYRIIIMDRDKTDLDIKFLEKLTVAEFLDSPCSPKIFKIVMKELADIQPEMDNEIFKHLDFHLEMQDYEDASKVCHKFIEKYPNNEVGAIYMGKIYLAWGKTDKAISMLNKALRINSENTEAKELLGSAYMEKDDHRMASIYLKDLSFFGQKDADRLINMSKISLAKGDTEEAEKYLKDASAISSSGNVEELEGLVKFQKGDIEGAKKCLQKSEEGTALARYFNKLAIQKIRIKQYKKGIKIYSDALRVMPDKDKHHVLYFNIGMAYLRWHKEDHAQKYFEKVLSINPKHSKAQHYLNEIIKRKKSKSNAA